MSAHFLRTLLLAAMLLALASASRADGLVTGHYVFKARYAGVQLDGVYPFSASGLSDGTIKLTTDVTGALSGEAELHGLTSAAAGTFIGRPKFIGMVVRTKFKSYKLISAGRLHGRMLTGTSKGSKGSVPANIDVSTTGPLDVTFDLNITVSDRGVITGTGTATACRQILPVTVKGSNRAKLTTLAVVGPKRFAWRGSGRPTDNGFTASWTGNGFGSVARGKGLSIGP